MEEQIKNDLRDLLAELPFTKKQQAAFLFLETRKLLERTDRLKTDAYIKFFCDWIMHTEKTYNLDVIRADFDKIAADMESQEKKPIVRLIAEEERHPFAKFVSFAKLRDELNELFSKNGITDNLTTDDTNWCSLRNIAFRILADQPIDFGDKPVRGIRSFSFNEVRNDLYGCILVIGYIKGGVTTKWVSAFVDNEPNFTIWGPEN